MSASAARNERTSRLFRGCPPSHPRVSTSLCVKARSWTRRVDAAVRRQRNDQGARRGRAAELKEMDNGVWAVHFRRCDWNAEMIGADGSERMAIRHPSLDRRICRACHPPGNPALRVAAQRGSMKCCRSWRTRRLEIQIVRVRSKVFPHHHVVVSLEVIENLLSHLGMRLDAH